MNKIPLTSIARTNFILSCVQRLFDFLMQHVPACRAFTTSLEVGIIILLKVEYICGKQYLSQMVLQTLRFYGKFHHFTAYLKSLL